MLENSNDKYDIHNTSKTSKKSNFIKTLIFSLLPVFALCLFLCWTFFNSMKTNVLDNMNDLTISKMENLGQTVYEEFLPAMSTVRNTQSIMNKSSYTIDEVRPLMESLLKSNSLASDYYFGTAIPQTEPEGFWCTGSGWVPSPDTDQTKRGWYISAWNNPQKLCISDPYVDMITGGICTTFSMSTKDTKGNSTGVLGIDILLSTLTDTVAKFCITKNGRLYIVDRNGVYLTNSDADKIMQSNWFDNLPNKIKALNAQSFLTAKANIVQAHKNYYASSPIKGTPWFVIAEGPMSDITGQVYSTLYFLIIVVLAAMFVIGLVLCKNLKNQNQMKATEQQLGASMFEATQNLSVSAKETAATSQDQSAAVKEIVATMEDSNTLSENIAGKIENVASVAKKTTDDVYSGDLALQSNVKKLNEISGSNMQTIEGIKALNEKIANVWDIVELIRNIADQAKIIAFNAELEAARAGDAGSNFHIVASEVRRLTGGILDGSNEIKEKIADIQSSSDQLILLSESGTTKIKEGCETAQELSKRFTSISEAASVTADSACEITNIIQQQTAASGQILITLKQIASGVENFTAATENISASTEQLKTIAFKLNEHVSVNETENT